MKPVSILNSCCPQVGKSLLFHCLRINTGARRKAKGLGSLLGWVHPPQKINPFLPWGSQENPFLIPFSTPNYFSKLVQRKWEVGKAVLHCGMLGQPQVTVLEILGAPARGVSQPWIQPQPLTGGFAFKRQHVTPSKVAGSTCAAITMHPPHPRGSQHLDSS